MTDDEMLEAVRKASGAFETYRLHHFKIWRKTPVNGGQRELSVTIYDAGPDEAMNRYMVEVRDAEPTGEVDPPFSLGNPDSTIQHALSNVHWNEFDKSIPD